MKNVALLLTLASLFAVSGCGFLRGGSNWDPFASQAERRIAIRVENANQSDVQVRVVAAGTRHDLGTIGGRSFRQTSIPWSASGDLRFEINPIAGPRFTTRGLYVNPGDRVELIVVNPLQRSVVRR